MARKFGPIRNKKRFRGTDVLVLLVLAVGGVVMVIPFVWMITTSMDRAVMVTLPSPPRFYPAEPSLYPYEVGLTNVKMPLYIRNSLIIAVGTIVCSLGSALLSGYALSKIRFKGHRIALVVVLSVMMIPMESTMVSKYLLMNQLKLLNSYWAIFLPALTYPFGTYLAKQFFDTLPNSLREAAKIDGAGEFRNFVQVHLPLCGASTATMTILLFLGSWNDLLWPLLILNDMNKYNIQIGLALFSLEKNTNPIPAVMMAITTVSIIPVLVLYLFLQRYIVEGVAMSGLKQ